MHRPAAALALATAIGTLAQGAEPASVGAPDGVRLVGHWLEGPVRRAVLGATRPLAEPSCAAVLGDFRDGSGHTLRERLGETGQDAPSYVRMVLFYDGSNEEPCRRPRIQAFTAPGSRLVRVCPGPGRLAAAEPERAESIVIHEVLHTLGLEENPPSSEDITRGVEKRCPP